MSDDWHKNAIKKNLADRQRSSDTDLLSIWLPNIPNIELYLKNEGGHKTGSLKHRLARSLYLLALVNKEIGPESTCVEVSSGNTAVSEAYFAQLLKLKFIAVMPKGTSKKKITRIEQFGGECLFAESAVDCRRLVEEVVKERSGYFLDQFNRATLALSFKDKDSITAITYEQLLKEKHPIPKWFVVGVGTGGTAATIGRYNLLNDIPTKLCVVDPEFSVYYDCYTRGNREVKGDRDSRIEGIGRPYVPSTFLPLLIHRMIKVPDGASVAALRFIKELTGIEIGGSSGTTVYGALKLIGEMHLHSDEGSVVAVLNDSGSLYQDTYYSDEWLVNAGIDFAPYLEQIRYFYNRGIWKKITEFTA